MKKVGARLASARSTVGIGGRARDGPQCENGWGERFEVGGSRDSGCVPCAVGQPGEREDVECPG